MKSTCLLATALSFSFALQAQSFSLSELLNLAGTSAERFLHTTGKKGYQAVSSEKSLVRVFNPKDSISERYLVKKAMGRHAYLQLEKLTPLEYEQLKKAVLSEGFEQGKTPDRVYTELFTKKELTITAAPEIDLEEGKRWYNVSIEKRNLPRMRDLQFAEDLLAFDAHQHLILAFGKDNVVKDKYHNEDGTTATCSVIFPNSSREAVFLWKDKENMRQLHCIRVGDNQNTSGARNYNNQVARNQWLSKQGIYATMTLNQLEARNGATLSFYGWGSGIGGNLCPGNKGNMDFTLLDLTMNCLNCNDDRYYGNQQLNSTAAIEDGRRIYVSTMIFYPPSEPGH